MFHPRQQLVLILAERKVYAIWCNLFSLVIQRPKEMSSYKHCLLPITPDTETTWPRKALFPSSLYCISEHRYYWGQTVVSTSECRLRSSEWSKELILGIYRENQQVLEEKMGGSQLFPLIFKGWIWWGQVLRRCVSYLAWQNKVNCCQQ